MINHDPYWHLEKYFIISLLFGFLDYGIKKCAKKRFKCNSVPFGSTGSAADVTVMTLWRWAAVPWSDTTSCESDLLDPQRTDNPSVNVSPETFYKPAWTNTASKTSPDWTTPLSVVSPWRIWNQYFTFLLHTNTMVSTTSAFYWVETTQWDKIMDMKMMTVRS